MTAIAKPKKRGAPLLLLISFYSFFTLGITPGLLNIAWTYIQETFNVSLDMLGVLLTAAVVGRLTTAFASGRVIGRFGLPSALVASSLLIITGALGYMLAPTWELLLLSAVIASLGSGLIDAGMNTYASSHFSTGQLNWLHSFFGLGLTIGPIIITFIVVNLGQSWRLGYGVLAAIALLLLIAILATFPRWRVQPPRDDDDSSPTDASMLATLRVPAVLLGMLLFFIYAGVEVGAGQLSNTLFLESWNVNQETAAFWISFYWGSFTIGRMIVGTFADRVSNVFLMRMCMAGAVVGASLLWLRPSDLLGFMGLALLGFSLAPMFAVLISETPRRVGRAHTANAVGFQIGFAGLGAGLLPGLAGVLATQLGLEFIGLFIVINTVLTLLLHEFLLLRDRRQKISA